MAQRRVVLVAVLAALVVGNVAIARLSAAAFGAEAHNVWSQGQLEVRDEPVAAGLFDVEGMLPGSPEVRCLPLRYDGTPHRADLRFYADHVRGDLAPYLDVVVETGSTCEPFSPEAVVYEGTLAAMPRSWGAGTSTRPVVPGERRAWRFRVTLRGDPAAEGLEATAGFLWEARPLP